MTQQQMSLTSNTEYLQEESLLSVRAVAFEVWLWCRTDDIVMFESVFQLLSQLHHLLQATDLQELGPSPRHLRLTTATEVLLALHL